MKNKYLMPFNPRGLWHWAYFNNNNSVMSAALEAAEAGVQKQSSGLTGNWKTTKAGKTDVGGFMDVSAKIWFEQQRQYVRAVIAKLPHHQKALGNVLYIPAGDIAERDLIQIHNYLYKTCHPKLVEQFPNMKPEKRSHLRAMIYCAICHYWDAISPCIEGSKIKSMDADHKAVKEIMEGRDKTICTRRWALEWRPMWNLIIEEIRSIDNELLKPLDKHIEEWIERQDFGIANEG
jgi:hypothetical protein